ncbi:CATRA conflict system CASPASE/TPR repeat-associated protein [Amycolatopsis balhimycina]|uniref:CATRA conflict system CASPASE/TPR repeat-associated protein n=1 Tax=Amycolatopsis balhimycina TaxID=208443 RepID=UPI0003AA067D|nr:CATRA conflict system CASPASE/TPR repeat-associated protein [Amycolatopsis balhimycina]
MPPELVEPELVVHAFAPLTGPSVAAAYDQLGRVWTRCRSLLGTTEPLPVPGLPTGLPERPPEPGNAENAVAGQENPGGDRQAIVRRVQDVLVFSLVFTGPGAGWRQAGRRWATLAAGSTGDLLGTCLLHQAKHVDEVASPAELAAALDGWAECPEPGERRPGGFTVWDFSPPFDAPIEQRLVVLAPAGRDAELSAWTWSRGDVVLPPLPRYLAQVAKIRYQSRVWQAGQDRVEELRTRLDEAVEALGADPGQRAGLDELARDRAQAAIAATRLRDMARTVEICAANLTTVLGSPLAADLRRTTWLADRLADSASYVDNALRRAEQVVQAVAAVPAASPAPAKRAGTLTVRLGYALDIVGFSKRPAPRREALQRRLAALSEEVLADLGVPPEETDHQGTGDGLIVFLPDGCPVHEALPRLLNSWHTRLAADNARHAERLRLRLAVAIGPFGLAALGFRGQTVIEVNRLLDSELLRGTLAERDDLGLAALVSDQLYGYVVGDGYPGLDPGQFHRHDVTVKSFSAQAWLWTAG